MSLDNLSAQRQWVLINHLRRVKDFYASSEGFPCPVYTLLKGTDLLGGAGDITVINATDKEGKELQIERVRKAAASDDYIMSVMVSECYISGWRVAPGETPKAEKRMRAVIIVSEEKGCPPAMLISEIKDGAPGEFMQLQVDQALSDRLIFDSKITLERRH